MFCYWSGHYTKAQTLTYLRALECEEELPPVGHSLWVSPPGAADVSCITKTRAKGPGGRLLYRLDLYCETKPAPEA